MVDGRDNLTPIVLDYGSNSRKVGFAGDDAPFLVDRTLVGYPKFDEFVGILREIYFGTEALQKRGALKLRAPVQCGIISDWDEMEKLLHHTFYNELCVSPESHPVLLTEPPFNPKTNREKTAEIMFETFHVPAMYLALQSVLSLYASGHTTGLVIECGEEFSHTVPIYEGHAIPHAISKLDLGGRNLTRYMWGDIEPYFYNISLRFEVIEKMKIKIGYVALEFDKEVELAKSNPTSVVIYEHMEHKLIPLQLEIRCPEVLFQPSLVPFMETSGIHEKAHDSIMKCDMDIRKSMYNTIVLSGGTTMFPGFANRVSRELSARAPEGMEVKVIAPEERIVSPWIGGSILASLDTFRQMWISRSEYDEYGPAIVHKKCF